MNYVISDFGRAEAAVKNSQFRFPVRRIYLVGRNYAEHAREMGHDPNREEPFFFQKPSDAVLPSGSDFPYPPGSSNVHHEIELVVALQSGASDINPEAALDHVYGYAVGIDITRRDLQQNMKKMGRPWEAGKSFDKSAPISEIVPATECGHPQSGRIWLKVDSELRQQGDLNQLIWSIPEIISKLSEMFELSAGDIIFTGTPAGVGPIARGDRLTGGVDGVCDIDITVV
ncbi:MAG: fumarylacetoacetate hydrolase family protein [Acidiferrobacterales bacterium]|nr:fumarylacetoacetate hydrolase family protein [Acidiferrobacterales bacterium]